MDRVLALAAEKAAVIFIRSSCCMCHSITKLFHQLGASPAVHELDRIPGGVEMDQALRRYGHSPAIPAVFIGGRYVGTAAEVFALHLDGSLREMLINAKAIWL